MKMKSVMSHSFSQVPKAEIPRSSFDRSHGYKTTFDSGYLVPFLIDEVLPGDTFNVDMTGFARLSTPIKPLMDNMYMDTQFFAVPMRLLWANWQKFNGEQTNPGDSTSFVIPNMVSPAGGYLNGSLEDYFGIPTQVAGLTHSCLWHRAYNLIYNQWYRDENLQPSVYTTTGDGPDVNTNYAPLRRGKRYDYFTSCLPWPQKGAAVQIPMGTSATVKTSASNLLTGAQTSIGFLNTSGANPATGQLLIGAGASNANLYSSTTNSGAFAANLYPSNLYADLSTATAATINQLRQAFQIQKLLERDARGGTRYTEIVKSHFGVTSPDARLQRPEYLGGGSSPINIAPVAKTGSTDATTPQGNLAGFGTAVLHNHGFTKSFTEHCLIIGLVSVRADLTYQNGLDRMFSRSTRYDFYWPALSHIGEQAVLNQEIYAQGTAGGAADSNVFGYQERYAEYRYKPSRITGQFRSNFATPLDMWHLSQKYTTLPVLGPTFIVEYPPIGRVIAVPSEPEFIFDAYIRMKCARPMPVYGVPGLIDHF